MAGVKTIFIVFIHGFKGDEETFFQFPQDLKTLVQEKVQQEGAQDLKVETAVYPKYDTRGDLGVAVEAFKEWLQGQVTELEVKEGTKGPIQNPSVGVVLVAHSVGGLVAADTLFSVLDNRPVSSDEKVRLVWPLVYGLMAFDTPYNGLSRSMFAYGAFSQYQNISSLWNVGTSVGALISAGSMSGARTAATSQLATHASKTESWKRWQFLAARTGTYGAIIAGGVAAYVNRKEIAESLSKVNKQNISESWSKVNTQNIYSGLAQVPAYVSRDSIGEGFTWMASHLKFVGALMKPAQLKMRLERLGQLKGIGVANFYASLGENGYWTGGYFVPKRTFCAVPKKGENGEELFREQPNADASDEIAAHCSMFRPQKNPKYAEMKEKAGDLVLEWLKNDPRSVVDEYTPSHSQRERSMSEAQLWDDDGNVLSQKQEKDKEEGDEEQLERILKADGMPEEVDGGVTDEDLEKAKELPLPEEDVSEEDMKKLWDGDGEKDASKTWRSRLAPFTRISMPSMPNMPNLPQMQVPSMPSIPSFRKSSQKKEDGTDEDLKRKADDAFPAEDEKAPALPPRPEDDTAEGNVTEEGREILNEAEVPALSPRTEEKQQDKNLTDEGFENGSGDEVKREVAEQLQEIHRDLPADVAEKRADEVLKGWGVPIQGEDVVDRDQIAVPEEQNVPSKEVIKEKAPVDT